VASPTRLLPVVDAIEVAKRASPLAVQASSLTQRTGKVTLRRVNWDTAPPMTNRFLTEYDAVEQKD